MILGDAKSKLKIAVSGNVAWESGGGLGLSQSRAALAAIDFTGNAAFRFQYEIAFTSFSLAELEVAIRDASGRYRVAKEAKYGRSVLLVHPKGNEEPTTPVDILIDK